MSLQVGLRDINQRLPEYIQMVEQGEEIMITRRGKPIAKIIPVIQKNDLTQAQQAALKRSLSRMKQGFNYEDGTFNRSDLYDRGQD